jgi:hypothetical protein
MMLTVFHAERHDQSQPLKHSFSPLTDELTGDTGCQAATAVAALQSALQAQYSGD